jgi:hypothetical protein
MTVIEFEQWVRWWKQEPNDNLPVVTRTIGQWLDVSIEDRKNIHQEAGTYQRRLTKRAGKPKP